MYIITASCIKLRVTSSRLVFSTRRCCSLLEPNSKLATILVFSFSYLLGPNSLALLMRNSYLAKAHHA
jgi:hypothetical protein